MTHRPALRLLALIAVIAPAACSSGSGSESPTVGEWEFETSTVDNVTTVRTISGSVWGGAAILEEELSIGVESGEDPYMLGNVRGLAEHNGEIFVLDRQVPVVRVYDLSGRHLRDLGKDGQGPAEFRQPESMVIGLDGRLYLRDPRNGRIMILTPDGEEAGTIPIRSGFSTSSPMLIANDGTLYNNQLLDPSAEVRDWVSGYVPMFEDESMSGDSIAPPDFPDEPARLEARSGGSMSINTVPFTAQGVWALSPSGAVISGFSDGYTFEIRYPDGSMAMVEKSWEPVKVDPGEADWQRKITTAGLRTTDPEWVWNGPEIPASKPAFSRFLPDRVGRIWVNRPGPGHHVEDECLEDPEPETIREAFGQPCWSAGTTWEVFDEEGRFLGTAELPEGVQTSPNPYITEDHFLTSFMDDLGTVMVKRFRIVVPGD